MFTEVFSGQFGISVSAIEAFLKGTGLIGIAGVVLYLSIKNKVIRLVSVDSGTELIRARWGKERYYRTGLLGHQKGRLIRLKPGGHLMVRGLHDGWEISKKEIVLATEELHQSFRGRVLVFDLLTFGYQVIATDDKRGDTMMTRSFLSVRNIDRENQKSEELDEKVQGTVTDQLRRYLGNAKADDNQYPVIRQKALIRQINKRLAKDHGVKLISLLFSAPVWKDGQLHFDGLVKIADRIAGTSSPAMPDNVVELAKSEPA